jgi:2-polyprenyl-3-methyl-5-hydroxy-6-metoxy-1,4-benzoquinol methylase
VSDTPPLSEYAEHNQRVWDERSTEYQSKHGPQLEQSGGNAWGVWQLPEAQLQVLGDVRDRDVLEFGCGAAQWSIALAALGARVTALDASGAQLEHARSLMTKAPTFRSFTRAPRRPRSPMPHSTSSSATTAR